MKALKHQDVSLKFMKDKPEVYDASDPGTGKTFVEIMDFAQARRKKSGCALVFAPKSLLHSAWRADFAKFTPDMRTVIARAENRAQAFALDADAYITNIDAAVWLSKQPASFFKRFDRLIIDEATAYKHRTSARSKAIAKIRKHFRVVRLLSGTPNPNGVTDLWHQYFILDNGKRLGKSFFAFRAACCTPKQVGPQPNMIQWVDKPGIEAVVGALIKDITIRHQFEDCVDIPENFKYAVPFELSKAHKKLYTELEALNIAKLKDSTVTAVNGAVLYTKLLQVASGAVYNDDGQYTAVASERYELVLDLVEQRNHSIVFFLWEHQKNELIAEAERRGLTWTLIDGSVTKKGAREAAVDGFQKGEFRVMFAHPKSAGHGLTLTKGTATIWASPPADLEWFNQGLKRVHRMGQTEKTETIVVVATGTRDENVWARLQDKSLKMTDLLNDLKEAA